ncbi:hypothetical protein J6590_088742 [Homalodisca vitripennis]|nr:hypothetical protein J6590_088742 [Homalodisca vitripennis]
MPDVPHSLTNCRPLTWTESKFGLSLQLETNFSVTSIMVEYNLLQLVSVLHALYYYTSDGLAERMGGATTRGVKFLPDPVPHCYCNNRAYLFKISEFEISQCPWGVSEHDDANHAFFFCRRCEDER